MFEQAAIPVQDKGHFGEVKAALEQIFAVSNVAGYLERLKRSRLRARDFEGALRRGLLGETVAGSYNALGASDRGQIREFYLSLVERVAPELRAKYLKSFAYY
jgi:hypothetical protein